MIRYTCPKCRAALECPAAMAGQQDECPICKSKTLVPAKADGTAAPPSLADAAAPPAHPAPPPRPIEPRHDQESLTVVQQLRQAATKLVQQELYEKARLLLLEVVDLSPTDTAAANLLVELPARIKVRDSRRLVAAAKAQLKASHCSIAIELFTQARTLAPSAEIETLLAQATRRRWRKWALEAALALLIIILIWQLTSYAANTRRLRQANTQLAQGNFAAAAQILAQTPDWLAVGKSDLQRRLRDAWVTQVESLTGNGLALEALALADQGLAACPDDTRLDYLGDKDRAAAHLQALGDQIQAIIDSGGMENAKSQQALAATRALDRLASTPRGGELRSRITERRAALQAQSDYEAALRNYDLTPWPRLAGTEWAQVQQAVVDAQAAGTDWKTIQAKYDEARVALPKVAAAAQTEKDRQAAVQAKTDYETALRACDPAQLARFAAADWARVQQAAAAAEDVGANWKTAKNKYDEARALLPVASTAAQAEMNLQQTAAAQAKAAYESALRTYDPARLAQFAAADWSKVQQAATAAADPGADWKTSKTKYDEARTLLPTAAAAAQTEMTRQQTAAAESKSAYETALRTYDPARLAQFANADWTKIQQAAIAASEPGADWKTAKTKYDEARNLLPLAAAAAQSEMTRQQTAAAESKSAYETALRTYDPARLAQFAADDWAKVQQTAAAAADPAADWKTSKTKYDEARALLPAVAAAAQTEMTRQQTAAAESKSAYETALRTYDPAQLAQFAAADWTKVLQAVADANAANADLKTVKTKYDEARALLPAVEAAAQIEMTRQAAVKAKADYETALQGYDRARLEQFGGTDWQQVQQALSAAETAAQDWKTAALQYDQARTLLPAADRTAATAAAQAARRQKIADLLAAALANDSPEKGKTALAALAELLPLDPQNAQALALQKKIANYYPPPLLVAPFTAPAAADSQQRWADHLNSQPHLTNTIGIKLALIPAGTFTMGTPATETARLDDEGPPHKVTLTRAFYLALTEVTQAQWQAVMGNTSNPSHFKGDDLPVDSVSWNDAQDFCQKLSQKEGRTYRLPTEAEWEYACRAGTTTPYYTGIGEEALKPAAWLAPNSAGQSHPVAQKSPNALGLYDMHGNVWEWCADYYGPYPPSDQTDPPGPNQGSFRVLRGGSWNNLPQFSRSGYRFWDAPAYRSSFTGFRVVLEPH